MPCRHGATLSPLLLLTAITTLACTPDGGEGDELAATETSSSDGDSSSSDDDSSSSDGDSTGSTDATESGSDTSTDTSDTSTSETTGEPECGPAEPIGDWLLALGEGKVFPNDVPNDVGEACTIVAGSPGALALDCPFAPFELQLIGISTTLPEPGANAQVRVHHEPGWLDWPDLWIDVAVEGGDHFAFQASSVLLPTQGSYLVPWSPASSGQTCGPYEDFCGPQQIEALAFEVEGEPVVAWHGSHVADEIAGKAFELWVLSARENLAPPETCDFSPRWYSLVSRRAL